MWEPFLVGTAGLAHANRLANAGLNLWTFSPTAAHTRLLEGGAKFTALAAFEICTRNTATDWKSGVVFRLESRKAVLPIPRTKDRNGHLLDT